MRSWRCTPWRESRSRCRSCAVCSTVGDTLLTLELPLFCLQQPLLRALRPRAFPAVPISTAARAAATDRCAPGAARSGAPAAWFAGAAGWVVRAGRSAPVAAGARPERAVTLWRSCCVVCWRCWTGRSRWPICSCCGGCALAEDGAFGRDGAAILGVAGRGGAAMCGIGRGAIAGRCGGGAGRNAGAAGRAIAGGGAGRDMAGGGAGRAIAGAGRAMAGGGAAGRAAAAGGPGLLCSWADELTLAATTETPRKNAVRRRPCARMIVLPAPLSSPVIINVRSPQSIGAPHCGFATQADG